MKHQEEPEKDNSERWMLSYLDFITLLFVFFVLLYSMSNVDQQKYEALAKSLNSALAGDQQSIAGAQQGSPEEMLAGITTTANNATADQGNTVEEDLQNIVNLVNTLITEKGLQNQVTVNMGDIGVWITFKDYVLFDSGSTAIKPETVNILTDLGGILKTVDNYVRIEGYTDNVPIQNSIYSNNWDLSVMRASKVLDLIVTNSGFPSEKISAIGYGEYRPVATNDTEDGRSKNRRVDIVILRTDFNATEAVH
ncbi:flagellar motor protein MotB [Acetobacterium tundrae]|uniref:OmpA family protein n=1 Tax=Acetobacterium tundrae TaxID=132932 RepID=A0ABR6WGV6_9FIRM|nr:flagellar motor protein MotB [Acetobacterium tundrae]MBC3795705.1 OmpA family protein [Acetobacterium tundrae]